MYICTVTINKQITKMKIYICTKDVPSLGMIKGRRYEIEENSPEIAVFSSMCNCFREEIPEDEKWQVGTAVKLTGRFANMTHSGKNRYGSGEMLNSVVARIIEIHPTGGDQANIMFRTDGGIVYCSQNCKIRKSLCTGDPKSKSSQKIVELDCYWFINSRGKICSAVIGKDEEADRWRLLSGNYHKTQEACRDYYQRIITTGIATGRPGFNHIVNK